MKWTYDLVILMDCWPRHYKLFDETNGNVDLFYERLQKKLSTMKFTNVALATYPNDNDGEFDEEDQMCETDPWLLDNLKSENRGANVNLQLCHTFHDIYKKFPELLNIEGMPLVLLCGQSFNHCTHWRGLGLMQWLEQQTPVFTHPDLCAAGKAMAINENMLIHDPCTNWVPEQTHSDDPPNEEYDGVWRAKEILFHSSAVYNDLIKYQYAVKEP